LLEDFLKKHPYNPASKYHPVLTATESYEPMTNYMDVSRGQPKPEGYQPLTTSLITFLSPSPLSTGFVLWHHLHRHPAAGLHRHLRHRLLQPVGALYLLQKRGLQ